MDRFSGVIAILDRAIGGPDASIGAHGAFWRGLSRDQFVSRSVFSFPLIVVGKGAESNLVKALKGQAPFGADLPNPPPGAVFPRMPVGFAAVTNEDIAFIERWIDDGCPADLAVATARVAAPPAPAPVLQWRQTPNHGGQGRFWNNPLSTFVGMAILGLPLIAAPGPNRGQNSNLVKALKSEAPFDGSNFVRMPLNRQPVAGEHIAFIQDWIDRGCPEE